MKLDDVDKLLGPLLAQEDDNFHKYCVERPDILETLLNVRKKVIIINAPRGSGKSGLLMAMEKHLRQFPSNRIFRKFPTDLSFPPKEPSVSEYASFWQDVILSWIVADIGSRKELALSDDDIIAVKESDQSGLKPKNKLRSLLGRVNVKGLPFEQIDVKDAITQHVALRLIDNEPGQFWVLLDEMDDNFEATKEFEHRLVGLFEACQAISRLTSKVKLRVTIRPHVMTLLKLNHEKVQIYHTYAITVRWDLAHLREILAKRIKFLDMQVGNDSQDLPELKLNNLVKDDTAIIDRYFQDFDLSMKDDTKSDYRALATLVFFRPRWLLELCRTALLKSNGARATAPDFKKALHEFGTDRLEFTISEHKSQFPYVAKALGWLEAIRKQRFADSKELRNTIFSTYPFDRIPNDLKEKQTKEIANMLYILEIIRPKENLGGADNHRFLYYSDYPLLLSMPESGPRVEWHLHPTFASAMLLENRTTYRPGSGTDDLRIIGERAKRDQARRKKNEEELKKLDQLKRS